jgi:chromosome segregation ATPase
MADETKEIIDPYPDTPEKLQQFADGLNALLARFDNYKKLAAVESKNASDRWFRIQELEATVETLKAESQSKSVIIESLEAEKRELVAKLASYANHPDVIAAKKKAIETEKARLEAELKKLEPTPENAQ